MKTRTSCEVVSNLPAGPEQRGATDKALRQPASDRGPRSSRSRTTPPSSIDARMKQLELESYLTEATVQININFVTYNAHYDLMTLHGMHFLFSRSGHIWKRIVHESLFLQAYPDPLPMLACG